MVTVLFENVGEGRDERLSFKEDLKVFDGQELIRAIKRSKALRGYTDLKGRFHDAEPDVWYDLKTGHGKIYIGGYKPVGTFRVV